MTGLQWVKMDLHVHTWASKKCFDREHRGSDEEIAEAVVQHCLDQELAAIAITDHNTGEAIDVMKATAKGTDLVIFPGVEVSVPAGDENPYYHIIGIFPRDWDSAKMRDLLVSLKFKGEYGQENVYCGMIAMDAINEIHGQGGFAVLPHPDGSQGFCGKGRGKPREDVMTSGCVSAVEHSERVKKFYPNIAQYRASDGGARQHNGAHTVKGIGTEYSLFKVGEVTFEALRQCFEDPHSRIIVDAKLPPANYPRLDSMRLTGGFLDGEEIEFHSGLNAILGGKGVGKSLLVEFLRFALDQQPSGSLRALEPIRQDHQGKLRACLQAGGKVEVLFRDAAGVRYRVTRAYNGSDNPIEIVNLESNESLDIAVAQLMRLVVFSQREVVLTVEDDTARTQWLDRARRGTEEGLPDEAPSAALVDNDYELARAVEARDEIAEAQQHIDTLREQLKGVRSRVDSAVAREMSAARKKQAALGDIAQFHEKITDALESTIRKVREFALPAVENLEDEQLDAAVEMAKSTATWVIDELSRLKAHNASRAAEQEAIKAAFELAIRDVEARYTHEMGEVETEDAELRVQQTELEKELAAAERAIADKKKAANQLTVLLDNRDRLLDDWERGSQAVSDARESRFNELNEAAGGRLRVELHRAADRREYSERLRGLKTGSHAKTLEAIAERVSIRRFVELTIKRDSGTLARESTIPETAAVQMITSVMDDRRVKLEDFLAWQYAAIPQDVADITYLCADEGVFKSLENLSTGQKCSALTILALADGREPVIIDQPEDSLDIKAVWEDVVQPVRQEKERRQFIFTTHNATLAVAGDSDAYTVLGADTVGGHVNTAGAIESQTVRPAVVQHLEGGREAYKLKKAKYGPDVE